METQPQIIITRRERNIGIIGVVILRLLLFGIAGGVMYYKQMLTVKENFISALNSELTEITISDSLKGKQIAVMEDINAKTILSLNTTNGTLKALQDEIRRVEKKLDKGSSVTVAATSTQYSSVDSSLNTITGISASVDSILRKFNQYPIYTDTVDDNFNGWIKGTIKIGHNFTDYNLSTFDTLALTVGVMKRDKGFKNLFKPKKPYADISSRNPYTNIDDTRTFRVTMPRKKRFVFFAGGGIMPFAVVQSYDGQRTVIGYGGGFVVGIAYKIAEF